MTTLAPALKRFRFVQDSDSHWYLIPAYLIETFRAWVLHTTDTVDWEYIGPDFDRFRVRGAIEDYTFELPRGDD